MALLFMDGFDFYTTRADYVGADIASPNGASDTSWSLTTGRGGVGNCLIGDGNAGQSLEIPVQAVAGTTLYFSFSFYNNSEDVPTGTNFFLLRSEGIGSQNLFAMGYIGGGSWSIVPNGGTTLYTPPKAFMSRAWNFVELSLTLGTTGANGAFELRINGINVLSATGIDTFFDADGASHLRLTSLSDEMHFDDLVIFTSAGAAPNTWLGDARIYSLLPTADGATVDWTANTGTDWQAVDDGVSDGDTTYIASSTVSQKSRFAMADLPTACTVHGVQTRVWAKKSDVGARTMRAYIRSSSSEANGDTFPLATDYAVWRGGYISTDPNGSIAWTKAAIDAMEVGVEVVS